MNDEWWMMNDEWWMMNDDYQDAIKIPQHIPSRRHHQHLQQFGQDMVHGLHHDHYDEPLMMTTVMIATGKNDDKWWINVNNHC